MTFKQTVSKAVMGLKKHSPAIFTGVGVIGLGVTAVLAYNSKDKVEVVVEEIERKRDLNIEINKVEVAKDIAEAIYKPVLVGALSVTAVLLAHKIQNNRIKVLVGTLAVEQARNIYFEKKYRKQHGEEEFDKFMIPTDDVETIGVDKKGKETMTVTQVKKEVDQTIGQWYDESREYLSDDHTYNITYIDSMKDRMQALMFQRGHVLLNEVREALGFERIRAGALLGWSTQDSFDIDKRILMTDVLDENGNPTGEKQEQIWVEWSRPRYIYDTVEFNGRYSIS
jgi:hypothetical protein